MKNFNLLLAGLMLVFVIPVHAQISQGGSPNSQTRALSLDDVPTTQLPALDLEVVIAEDSEDEKAGNFPRIGRVASVDLTPENAGAWTELQDGGRLWRVALKSRDAKGLSVQFSEYNLTDGAQLFIYTPDFSQVIGALTSFNNTESGVFSTQLIAADEIIVEYYEPIPVDGKPFRIDGLLHAYRMIPEAPSANREFGDSAGCQVNINCTEGSNWQDEKRGVVRILVFEGQYAGWCSGSLVNNTAQDCSPYVLTALHCGLNSTTSNYNQWVFYFNYESSGCANGSQSQVPNNTMSGCAKIASSNDGGGDYGSDYVLVELNNNVPQSYNAYYNGWRRNNVGSSSGVSIHHPSGDIKKISTYNSSLLSTSWGGVASNTHWVVYWNSTSNGHGVTEGGSSGSPIFDNNGYIIGTLTGGSSFCSAPNSPDLYGKMSYHWNSNPGDNLSNYLDPEGTGATSLGGTYAPCDSSNPDPDPECDAGTIAAPLNQQICPDETGLYHVDGEEIPAEGGFALQFSPDGGSGGPNSTFSISVSALPFSFDADLNGILSFNSMPPLSGQWMVTGYAFTDPENPTQSYCSIVETDITVNFLSAGDAACEGSSSGDCAADMPYPMEDPCVVVVIEDDEYCCEVEWDDVCENAYLVCTGEISDDQPCTEIGQGPWNNFNLEFGGAPANDGEGCPVYEITDFEIWMSEAYVFDNVVGGTSYTFSHCNGNNAGSWIPDYTVVALASGTIDAFGAGDGDGCSITWVASESGTYVVIINEAGNCGGASEEANGHPAITCNDISTAVNDIDAVQVSIFPNPNNGQFAITLQGKGGLAEVDVLEISGKLISHQTVHFNTGSVVNIDLEHVVPGMYFVRVSVNESVIVNRIVVQ